MNFIDSMKEKARKDIKKIVLPEASDLRTLKAAATALSEKYADVILIGNEEKINEMAKEKGTRLIANNKKAYHIKLYSLFDRVFFMSKW